MAAMQLTRTHRILIGLVVAGAVLIAAIGFAGSYAAVRELAQQKGFGNFSLVFPIGIDAGICVLLALDLLLTWLRIPFPLLRQTAWLLTAATIAFNGAAAWPDPLGVGMHAVIPVLFVVSVEAARHAVGRIADITADKHMEGVRLTRWLLSPVPTFRLWRRMKLWELRSYEQVIKLEQDRLIYQARLQARFGRNWRRKAPVESLMPLRLAKYGVPLADTGPAGLAAAGIEPALLPPAPAQAAVAQTGVVEPAAPQPELVGAHRQERYAEPIPGEWAEEQQAPQPAEGPGSHESPWFAAQVPDGAYEGSYNPTYVEGLEPTPVMIPSGPGGRTRPLGNVGTIGAVPGPRNGQEQPTAEAAEAVAAQPQAQAQSQAQIPVQEQFPVQEPQPKPVVEAADEWAEEWAQEDAEFSEIAYEVFAAFVTQHSTYPSIEVLDIHLSDGHNVRHPRSAALLRQLIQGFKNRYHAELEADHIA
ncbi:MULTISPECIES: DUF2637 domain-containing protein [unclassified Streptomyces]|uniref:DUF2637 domain-containing protein n=1 Tax=unclassified Streptomyces TaxID=2593676 RepID=UPI002254C965|nr:MULTISPECIES: DUF2637 domain-containing protein [unclassified Streptomyces]MCX5141006.1 DUF2637 domain-containing protein [Streptomyces sp. NBC_00338]